MAETKTGLEGSLGWIDETTTTGKVYYNDLIGSAAANGTKNAKVGTALNDGTSLIYWGSGYILAGGVWTHLAQGTKAVGSSGTGFACYNIEVGSDATVDITKGGTTAAMGTATIAARVATQAGHAVLGYVTVGTGGSVLAGSIVDERTYAVPTSISYVTGFEYSVDHDVKTVFNRATFAHYKPGRQVGKLSIKELYVVDGSVDIWPTSSTWHSNPTVGFELKVEGVAGTAEEVLLFQRCAKDSYSVTQPEDDLDSAEVSALFGSISGW